MNEMHYTAKYYTIQKVTVMGCVYCRPVDRRPILIIIGGF